MSECLICFTQDGKTQKEISEEILLNRRTHMYPLITLSYAYGCKCNSKAHNKCLFGLNKCPTCRKTVSKPNLYVKSNYDYVFGWLFNKIKSYPNIISIIKSYCALVVLFTIGLCICIDKNIIVIVDNWKYRILLGLLIFIQFSVGIIFFMEDYFKKYWLYDEAKKIINSI
jgi:hypothetical protein